MRKYTYIREQVVYPCIVPCTLNDCSVEYLFTYIVHTLITSYVEVVLFSLVELPVTYVNYTCI